jgi:Mlc titration factor MtfA (ptsG expression regulator)
VAWLHKLRRAMVRPDRELLAGVVEVDESFVGGRATGRLGASTDKVPVMIAMENVGTQVNRSYGWVGYASVSPILRAPHNRSTSPGGPWNRDR